MKKLASLSIRLNVVMLIFYCLYFQAFRNYESGGEIVEGMELSRSILEESESFPINHIYNFVGKKPALEPFVDYIEEGAKLVNDFENRIADLIANTSSISKENRISIIYEYHQLIWNLRALFLGTLSAKDVWKESQLTIDEFLERKLKSDQSVFLINHLLINNYKELSEEELPLILNSLKLDIRQLYHHSIDQLASFFGTRNIILPNAFPIMIPSQHLFYLDENRESTFHLTVLIGGRIPYQDVMKNSLFVNGQKVKLDKFGKGVFKEKATRIGRNQVRLAISPNYESCITGKTFTTFQSKYFYSVHPPKTK